jgi:hypothetical protein
MNLKHRDHKQTEREKKAPPEPDYEKAARLEALLAADQQREHEKPNPDVRHDGVQQS